MFIIWNGVILGSIDQAPGSGEKVDPLVLLTQSPGPTGLLIQACTFHRKAAYIPFSELAPSECQVSRDGQLRADNSKHILQVFSLFAIATSYIGFVLGLSDFLADLLKVRLVSIQALKNRKTPGTINNFRSDTPRR